MQSSYTHLDVLNKTRLFVQVIKTKLTPQLGILVPTVRRELDHAFSLELPPEVHQGEWRSFEAFEGFHRIVGRVSARIFGGKTLRDDPAWLDTAEAYPNNIFKTAITIRLVPSWAKYTASFFLPCSWKITYNAWKARRILLPYVRHRQAIVVERSQEIARTRKQEFPDVLQYLIERAEGPDANPLCLASMVLSLSLASNHTTAMALTEALYDLFTHPEYLPELREEVYNAVVLGGGWQKKALTKMRKLDRFIKESQRLHPPSLMGYKRKIKFDMFLSDGLFLPAGAQVEFPIVPIQHDNVPDADQFDALRFYRLRQEPGEAHRH
ncbi:MAG: hypothetical protein LQ351_005172 [Letrouitia transgressa]|nr:MAG: hypothetical protein LQ351_005172 [Letrouitia transgressa]